MEEVEYIDKILCSLYVVDRLARRFLRTFDELTYVLNCSPNKYMFIIGGLKTIEGGEYLILKNTLCRNASLLLELMNKLHVKGYSSVTVIKESYNLTYDNNN